MLFQRLFRPSARKLAAQNLYQSLVAAARQPWFYAQGGVADTLDGRFDMIALHAWLVLDRLSAGNAPDLAQSVFDLMFQDLDRSLREMGVGDLGVPRRIKAMIQAFYGRAKAYSGVDLEAALTRNLYRSAPPDSAILAQIVAYIQNAQQALGRQDLTGGAVQFPPPP